MVVALLVARPFVLDLHSAALELVLLLAIGAAVYVLAVAVRAPDLIDELRALRRRRTISYAPTGD